MTRALAYAGRTSKGHHRLLARSKSSPGKAYTVLVAADLSRVSCSCIAAARHPLRRDGRLTLSMADVRAGTATGLCWHVQAAATWLPPVEIRKDEDGATIATAPSIPSVATLRRIARLIRRAGGTAERWGTILSYDIDDHSGNWESTEHDVWAGVCFMIAAERLGYDTCSRSFGARGGNSRNGPTRYEAEAYDPKSNLPAVAGKGPSRTMAAAALAVAVERLTRGKRRRR